MKHVAGGEIAPGMSAEASKSERGAASEVLRNLEPASKEQIGTDSGTLHAGELEPLACRDDSRRVRWDRLLVQ